MEVTARAIIITDKGLMVFYREKLINGKVIKYYAIPGGHVEAEESEEETVVRELEEELGIKIVVERKLGEIFVDGIKEVYFLCHYVSGEPKLGGEELLRNSRDNYYEFRYLPLNKLKDSGIRANELIMQVIE